MTNKEFDRWLRESLYDQHPDTNPGDWDSFVKRVEDSETSADSAFDYEIRDAMSSLGAGFSPDWNRMEEVLDAETRIFDDHVRSSVEHLDVPYNAQTWPVLDARLSQEERTRRRVIVAKVFEIAAILIALFTFYNIFPAIQSNIYSSIEDRQDLNLTPVRSTVATVPPPALTDQMSRTEDLVVSANAPQVDNIAASGLSVNTPLSDLTNALVAEHDSRPLVQVSFLAEMPGSSTPVLNSNGTSSLVDQEVIPDLPHNANMAVSLNPLPSPGLGTLASSFAFDHATISAPGLRKTSKVRFGMMAAADVNKLFVPDDFFYSQGRAIRFSEKEIEAGGYTAGASLLFDEPRFLIETGVTYSSKTFGPDRTLFIGTSPDQHELDFENITLDVVSVPLYLHLKIDGKGLWRFYTVGGASLHVIANAHYDLVAENTNPPASAAPLDPMQLQNQREVQRVREHMLDGAKFNSKAYLTAAGGLGVERFLNSRTSIFAQPMYHYQISFFGLIDQNGKHLSSISLLLGTRISL